MLTQFFCFICSLAIALFALSSGGCATIIHGSNQDLTVSTSPPGATLQTADGATYVTPAKITVKRNKDHVFAITKPGYHTEQVSFSSVLSGAVFGNIILGGIIGGIVDAASGAAWRVEPEIAAVTLRALGPGEKEEPPTFVPLTAEQRLANLEKLKVAGNITNEDYEATKKSIDADIAKRKAGSSPSDG